MLKDNRCQFCFILARAKIPRNQKKGWIFCFSKRDSHSVVKCTRGRVGSYAFGAGGERSHAKHSILSPSPKIFIDGRVKFSVRKFWEGAKDLNTSSKSNFAENTISPSPNLQANSTLPSIKILGEGDSD